MYFKNLYVYKYLLIWPLDLKADRHDLKSVYFPDFYFAGIQKKILKVKHTVDHLNGGSFIVAKIIRFESFVMAPVVTCLTSSIHWCQSQIQSILFDKTQYT